jgi:hypothetical protein
MKAIGYSTTGDVEVPTDIEIPRSVTQNLGRITAKNRRRAHQIVESGQTIGKIALEGF